MKILSIESSCDDSALAFLDSKSGELLWQGKISQEDSHKIYGGVVPELASRLFAIDLPQLLGEFKRLFGFECVDVIAVTYEPGLSTSLLEGVMMAKSLALSLQIPLIPINHLKGHIFSLFINKCEAILPLSILLVSGGHSMILECYGYYDVRLVSSTLDDSFGECYDKVAKMLGLGYPGGAIIDSMARRAALREDVKKYIESTKLPIPLSNQNTLNFSFSGLKNAFRLKLRECEELTSLIVESNIVQEEIKESEEIQKIKDSLKERLRSIQEKIKNHPYALALAFNLQESATQHLYQKCRKYLLERDSKKDFKNADVVDCDDSDDSVIFGESIKHFAIVGGASANSMLREKIENLCDEFGKILLLSDLHFCADNAVMIARACMQILNHSFVGEIQDSHLQDSGFQDSSNSIKLRDLRHNHLKWQWTNSIESNILNLEINPRNTEIF